MTKYIIYNSQFLAQTVSYKYAVQNSKRPTFKWSHMQNIAKTKSCLILEFKADYVDITGETVKANCTYNDFLDLAKDFCAYTEVENLDETWNLEN